MPTFNQIPIAWRVPLTAAEIDTAAGATAGGSYPYRVVLIGQRLTAGSVAEAIPKRITSDRQGVNYFGAGSMLAQMIAKYRAVDSITELWAVSLDDAAAGVEATKTVTITGTSTADGTIALYVAGRKVTAAVTSGDANNAIAAAIEAALDLETDLPYVASVSTNVVTLTAQHKGAVQNTLDVRLNYASDDATPAGLTVAIAAGATGITNPVLQTALTALGSDEYDVIVQPYTDSTSLTDLETFLTESWDAMTAIDTVALTAMNGTVSDLGTLGDTRNHGMSGIVGATKILNPIYEVAASAGAQLAYQGNIDQGRPFNTLPLTGINAPATTERPTKEENNNLLYDGISPFYVDAGGVVRIVELITTYRTNALGADDESWLYFNDVLNMKYLRKDHQTVIMSKFPRYKLAADGTRVAAGQKIITPAGYKAELVAMYRVWEAAGRVQNAAYFKANVVVEIDAGNPGRLNVVLPITLISGLRFIAAQLQF